MNQLAMTFVETRARRNDCDTSKAAAKAATSHKASAERVAIRAAVKTASNGLTAYEVADLIGVDRQETSRRMSECGLHKTAERRQNIGGLPGAVWVAA